MDINLNEARNIIARLEKTVRELEEKRDNIASVLIAPGEDYHDYINDTVDNISERIIDYNIAINTIHEIIMMANVGEKITFNGKEMSIAAALNLVKQRRRETSQYKKLGKFLPRKRGTGFGEKETLVKVATFDIQKYANIAAKMEEENEELSRLIDENNQKVIISIDDDLIPSAIVNTKVVTSDNSFPEQPKGYSTRK